MSSGNDSIHLYAPSNSSAGRPGIQASRRIPADANRQTKFYKKATWKASLVLHSTKVFMSTLFCFVFFYVDVADTGFPLQRSFSSNMHDAFLSAWKLSESITSNETYWMFGWNLGSAIVGYVVVLIVLHTNMQKGSLAIPLVLSVPLSLLIVAEGNFCDTVTASSTVCHQHVPQVMYLIPTAAALVIGQLLSFGKQVFVKGHVSLLKETEVGCL